MKGRTAESGFWSQAFRRVVDRRRRLLALYLLMALAAAPGLWMIETDNSPEVFFVRDADVLRRYDRFQQFFGRDRSLRVIAQGEGLWTRPGLRWLAEVERTTRSWTGVVGAVGLYGRHRWEHPEWPPDPESLRSAALLDPLDRNMGWIDAEGRMATTFLALSRLSPDRQRRLLDRLEEYLKGAPPGVEARVTGLPVINRALDREVGLWVEKFLPILALLGVGLLAAAFRRAIDVLIPVILVGVCLSVVFGAMGYSGVRLNLVLMLLAPLLFVVSLATAVHILVRYRQLAGEGRSPEATTLATYRDKAWPTFWTGVTTAAGFGSLAVAEVPPIRQFGLWAAFGMALVTLACFTLYPSLLASFGGGRTVAGEGFRGRASGLGAHWAAHAVKRRRLVFAVFALSAVVLLAGASRLGLDSNALHYLAATHPARADLEALEKAGVAGVAAEIALESEDGEADWEDPESLRGLTRLSRRLRGLPLVLGAVGPGDILDSAPPSPLPGPRSDDDRMREALRRMRDNPETRPWLGASLTRGGKAARLTLLVKMRGYDELQPVLERALQSTREAFPAATVYLTGQYALVLEAQKRLLATMLFSLLLTLLAVALVFRLITGSLRLTLLVLAPNLWPVCFVVGGLGWVGFPLDSTTVMIASVALGLAVDDTLHALGAFRRRLGAAGPARAAVEALRETAPGQILTTLVLSLGFAICGLSNFVPVSRFGAMLAAALLAALVADLWLTPAVLNHRQDACSTSGKSPHGSANAAES